MISCDRSFYLFPTSYGVLYHSFHSLHTLPSPLTPQSHIHSTSHNAKRMKPHPILVIIVLFSVYQPLVVSCRLTQLWTAEPRLATKPLAVSVHVPFLPPIMHIHTYNISLTVPIFCSYIMFVYMGWLWELVERVRILMPTKIVFSTHSCRHDRHTPVQIFLWSWMPHFTYPSMTICMKKQHEYTLYDLINTVYSVSVAYGIGFSTRRYTLVQNIIKHFQKCNRM